MRTGLFEHWQAEYAERSVATFPVRDDKTPAIRGYLKVGSDASAQLAITFPDALGIGLAAKRNRITVLDVDTVDERVLADGLTRFGPTPFVVRTGSGHYQAWYRRNGEGRRIRPDPKVPIDILGDGFVVAPPSQANTGVYQIIEGRLDDLLSLPKMSVVDKREAPQKVERGARNNTLWRFCMVQAGRCTKVEDLMEIAMQENRSAFYEPLPDEEVLKIVASAWTKQIKGENWFGNGGKVVLAASEIDIVSVKDPYAVALLMVLRRHHWGRRFRLANATADKLGWTLRRFYSARDRLVELGFIRCVHPGGRGVGDPPIYEWGKVSEIAHQ